MKFSVLLPTRNRLELLKQALHSVLCQDYEDWEVVISDNFSDEDIYAYISALNEPRIKYFRTTSFVPVTENWNSALEKSSGDYVIMLGDDDCLMKGYFTTVCQLLEKFPEPECIYTSGFTYAYPNVFPGMPEGFLNVFGNAGFLQFKNKPFWLTKFDASKLVQEAMNFRVMFAYNMQYAIISRTLIDKMRSKGQFFQSPYPDYYAMTAILLAAEKILACPYPLVTVGISPKSFGFYYFNQKEGQGTEFLKNTGLTPAEEKIKKLFLPGTSMNTSWLLSMELVKNNFQDTFSLQVNYSRYRLLQIFRVYKEWCVNPQFETAVMTHLWKLMSFREKITLGIFLHCGLGVLSFFSEKFLKRVIAKLETLINSHPSFFSQTLKEKFPSIQHVFEEINPLTFQQDECPQ